MEEKNNEGLQQGQPTETNLEPEQPATEATVELNKEKPEENQKSSGKRLSHKEASYQKWLNKEQKIWNFHYGNKELNNKVKLRRKYRKEDYFLSKKKLYDHMGYPNAGFVILKNSFGLHVKRARVVFSVLFVIGAYLTNTAISDRIHQMILDSTPISDHAYEDILPNKDVPRDEQGNIIEAPVVKEELIFAFDSLTDKLLTDLHASNIKATKILSIDSIFQHDQYSEGDVFGDDKVMDVLLTTDAGRVLLRYLNKDSSTMYDSRNDTESLSSLNIYLLNLYPYATMMSDDVKEAASLVSQDAYIANSFNSYNLNGDVTYNVPVYTGGKCTLYSISDRDLNASGKSAMAALLDDLNGKSNFFKSTDIESQEIFNSAINAYNNAIKVKEDYEENKETTEQSPAQIARKIVDKLEQNELYKN